MIRSVVAVLLLLGAGAARGDDKDSVKDKLFAAKAAYDTEMMQYRKLVGEWFDKREDAARKDGNKKQVDQIKNERKTFDEDGELPKSAPTDIRQKPAAASKALTAAYAEAIKVYLKAKKDDEAAAVEKELQAFHLGYGGGLLGTWKVTVGKYNGEWTFKEGGVVDSSTSGAADGKWVLDTTKRAVIVTWTGGLQDKFDLPLNAKGTTGSQVGRMKLKLEAVKIK